MPFEEFDKKIKEAASNHHPAYDEKAWDKMEGLLNKHMPHKKEKKRAALWLLLLLITTGGAGYFIFTKTNNDKPAIATTKNNKAIETTSQSNKPGTSITNELSPNENTLKEQKELINLSLTQTEQKDQNKVLSLSVIKPRGNNKMSNSFETSDNSNKENPPTTDKQNLTFNPDPSINKSNDKSYVPVTKDPATNPVVEEKRATDLSLTTKQKDIEELETQDVKSKSKTKTRKGNGLFFSLSAGPDVGTVGMDNAGKLKLAAGLGIGYKISDRFSIQTGFYTARKIYTTDPYDYNAPNWWWSYYPTLEKVEADCKVYEIPLLLNYNFTRNNRGNWFGTIGLSSYLMKKEDYKYHYKTSSGQPATRSFVYNNENKHYFNVVTLAGGYERNLSKNLSLSVSPYFKTPLKGVGFGKVKLNSAGIMLNANFKPFVRK